MKDAMIPAGDGGFEHGKQPKPHVDPPSLFAEPGAFGAWGLANGQYAPAQLADLLKAHGFRWFCQQVGDPTVDPPDEKLAEMKAECHKRGLKYGVWEVDPKDASAIGHHKPDFYVANCEHRDPRWAELVPLLVAAAKPTKMPLGLVTNLDIDPKPWIAGNVKVLPEAYQMPEPNGNPNATCPNMVGQARRMGWKKVFPCVGVYDGYPLAAYSLRWAGGKDGVDGWSVYLVEGMTAADWDTASRLTAAK